MNVCVPSIDASRRVLTISFNSDGTHLVIVSDMNLKITPMSTKMASLQRTNIHDGMSKAR